MTKLLVRYIWLGITLVQVFASAWLAWHARKAILPGLTAKRTRLMFHSLGMLMTALVMRWVLSGLRLPEWGWSILIAAVGALWAVRTLQFVFHATGHIDRNYKGQS